MRISKNALDLNQMREFSFARKDNFYLSPNELNPENAVKELVSFLPVLAYDGANMTQIDAGGVLDIAMAGLSGFGFFRLS